MSVVNFPSCLYGACGAEQFGLSGRAGQGRAGLGWMAAGRAPWLDFACLGVAKRVTGGH